MTAVKLAFDCRFRYHGGFELDAAFEADGSTTAICGPSGSGKTTVLSLIAGLLRPSEGHVVVEGRTLVDTRRGICVPPEHRGVGLVFQDSLLFPHRTVKANLAYGMRRRARRALSLERVATVLEIGGLLGRRPATLSGGEARRVALGRALLRGPSLLMLDEPLTGLDEALKDRVIVFLQRSFEEWRIPTLLVSHDRESVVRLADRVVSLREGRVESGYPGTHA